MRHKRVLHGLERDIQNHIAVETLENIERGMPPEELETIFDPGFKVTAGRVSTGNWSLFSSRQIIFSSGRVDGAGPGELITLKLEVRNFGKRIEIFAVRHCCFAVVMQDMARVVSVHMIAYERETPVKRPHHAVGGPESQTIFPIEHPALVSFSDHEERSISR